MQIAADRTCLIRATGEPGHSPLLIRLLAPEPSEDGFVAAYELECAHFNERQLVPGDDAMQALLRLPMAAHARLLEKEDEGFIIYPDEDDDPAGVAALGFWGATKLISSGSGPGICIQCGAHEPPLIDDRSAEEIASDNAAWEAARQMVEADMARRRAERPVIPCTREVSSRVCQVRGEDGSELAPVTVRFFAPEPHPEFDFRSEFSVECDGDVRRTKLYGMDGIGALLYLPMIANAVLCEMESDGITVFHRTPGDLHEPGFWGVTRFTYDGERPNSCSTCRELRPVAPEVAQEQRDLLRLIRTYGART